MRIVRQPVLGFKMARTGEALTAHGGLALLAEYHHGLGLRGLVDLRRALHGPDTLRCRATEPPEAGSPASLRATRADRPPQSLFLGRGEAGNHEKFVQ